jgi:demethylmenaquinone methyltransferase/2-methoxy-6-polyprenyl-1,4-benzoquinol methylase
LLYNKCRREAMYSKDNPESIKTMFDNIAGNYDLINNIISFGVHNFIKDDALSLLTAEKYNRIIDLCSGTGDIAFRLMKKYPESYILATDFSSKMIEILRKKLRGKNHNDGKFNLIAEKTDVMSLPYDHNIFDLATLFFGLRNLPDVDKAIAGIYEILKPDAELLIVDLVKTDDDDNVLIDYFDNYMPKLASMFSKDKEAYQYLSASRNNFISHDGIMKILREHKFRIIKRKEYIQGMVSVNLAKKFV